MDKLSGMEIDPIASATKGFVSGAIEGFFDRKDAKAKAKKLMPPMLPKISSTPSMNPNWIVRPLAINHEKEMLLYAVAKTSSAVVSDLKISQSILSPDIEFYGDTEWPIEIEQNEPLLFMVRTRPFGLFGHPEITLTWADFDGNLCSKDFKITLTGDPLLDSL